MDSGAFSNSQVGRPNKQPQNPDRNQRLKKNRCCSVHITRCCFMKHGREMFPFHGGAVVKGMASKFTAARDRELKYGQWYQIWIFICWTIDTQLSNGLLPDGDPDACLHLNSPLMEPMTSVNCESPRRQGSKACPAVGPSIIAGNKSMEIQNTAVFGTPPCCRQAHMR